MKCMIRFMQILNLTCLVTVLCIFLVVGCSREQILPGTVKATQTFNAYEGPERAREQVAIVRVEQRKPYLAIGRIDGLLATRRGLLKDVGTWDTAWQIIPHGTHGAPWSTVALEPGEHTFLFHCRTGVYSGDATLKANLRAGHTYIPRAEVMPDTKSEDILGRPSQLVRVWFEDAATHERLGEGIAEDVTASIDDYEKVLESNPDSYEAHRMLGALYGIQKDYPKAKLHLQQSLRINPNQSEKHVSLMNNMISVIETIETVQADTDSNQAMLNMLEPFVDTVFKGSKTLLMSEREEN